ncbi:MAG: sulfatase-like hydrolase/transferase [Pseudomonadales bacterium]|nr:sulfatase-like hydrolase/transferase [Pseudomonadales bacterium]
MIKKLLVLITVLLPLNLLADTAVKATRQPNVLLIVADDLGVGDLQSFSAKTESDTPTIDALAAQGMRFSRFYTDSTCSASRAALLTGQYPARLGFHPVARGIASEIVTLPEWLRSAGYNTYLVGKWHSGELNPSALPTAQGFDTWLGFLNQWFLQGPDADGRPVLRAPVYHNPWLQDDKNHWQQYSGYLPDILTQRAVDNITQAAHADKPWLLWYATPLPHAPLHFPPEITANEKASDDEKYRTMLNHLDKNVAQLLQALEHSGQRDNTIIIFLSDNGAPEKRTGSNAAFAGGKAHYSEGAVRTPMLWVDPAVMPNSLDERAIMIEDIFPTLAARLGVPLPFVTDGVDFNALTSIKIINDRPMYWMSRGSASVLSADHRWRMTEEWTFRTLQRFLWWRVDAQSATDFSAWRYGYFLRVQKMRQQWLAWLNEVSRTAVQQEKLSAGGWSLSGHDFLRTPLKEWDFYVAVKPAGDARDETEQVLAEQAGVWSLRYNASQQQLLVTMYGHHWAVPLLLSQQCTLIGLNADIYDRYTNIGNRINPSKLLLSVNGEETARTEWQIDSLADVDVQTPTLLGVSSAQKNRWQGSLAAVFYHRANRVGEWPYFLDEAALRSELCARLQ